MVKDSIRSKTALALAVLGVAGLAVLFVFRPASKRWVEFSGVVWNTEYRIKYWSDRDLRDSVLAVLRSVELSVSPFDDASLLTAVNENRTDSLDGYLSRLFLRSSEISAETGGAFDPTVSPLVNAWGFGYQGGGRPDSAAIDSILEFVGIGKVVLRDGRICKGDSRMSFNFSAIAKGMGCDEVGRMLARNGVSDFLVEIGGEIVARGLNPRREKWRVSVDKPVMSADEVVHESAEVIAVSDCGVATSGNYRNYRVDESGRRYVHTIDPLSGFPVQGDVLSATVIAPDCMTADAYATAFMVMGFERSKALLSKRPELSALLIVASPDGGYTVWSNAGGDVL